MTVLPATDSAHARYRERISALLRIAAEGPIGGRPEAGWSIHTARFSPRRGSWAAVVQHGPRRGQLQTAVLYEDDVATSHVVPTDAGPAEVTVFPADPDLPSLGALLATADEPDVVRYRPGSRCTVRLVSDDGVRWLKVIAAGVSPEQAGEATARWQAHRRGELAFAVAEPDRFDVALSAEWQWAVPGASIARALRGREATALVRRLGSSLTSLNRSSLQPRRRITRDDQIARMERGVRRLARTVPDLADEVGGRLHALAVRQSALPPPRALPIHGSPHEHQWLLDGTGQLGLVDFDRWALGEPELDAATFLGEMYFERDLSVAIGDIEGALVAGFEAGGMPLHTDVLRWYLAHKLLSKVVRTTTALRVDGDQRAARHMAVVDTVLDLH